MQPHLLLQEEAQAACAAPERLQTRLAPHPDETLLSFTASAEAGVQHTSWEGALSKQPRMKGV